MRPQVANRDQDFGIGFFIGVLAGTAIGAAMGLLLAPKPGTELRADVRQAAERSAEAFRNARAARAQEPEPSGEL